MEESNVLETVSARPFAWPAYPVVVAGLYMLSVPTLSFNVPDVLLWVPQILVLLLLWVLILRHATSGRIPVPPPAVWFLGGWVAAAGLSFVFIPWTTTAVEHYTTVAKVFVITVLFSITLSGAADLKWLLGVLVVSIPVVVVMNLNEILTYRAAMESGVLSHFELEEQRLAGTLGNANAMGMYGMVTTWAAVTLFLVSQWRYRALALIPVPLAIYLVYLSGSRKALIAIPLSLLCLYLFYFRVRIRSALTRSMVFIPLLAILLVTSLSWIATSEQGYRFTSLFSGRLDSSASKRADMAYAGLRLFLEHPVAGIGFDQFSVQGWKYGGVLGMYSHSTFIELLACGGLVGLLLYSGSLVSSFVEIRRAHRSARTEGEFALFACALWLLVMFVFFSFFAVEFDAKIVWPLVGAIAGYAHRSGRSPDKDEA